MEIHDLHVLHNTTLVRLSILKPKNFEAMKVLRYAPPSNILKTKSQKVKHAIFEN